MKYLKTFWSTAFQQWFGILVISLAAVWFIFCFDSSHPGRGREGPQSATAAPMPRTADSVAQSIIQSTKEDIDRIQKGSTKFMFLYNRQPKDCNDIARVVQLADAFSQSTRTYSDPDRIQGKTTRRGKPLPRQFRALSTGHPNERMSIFATSRSLLWMSHLTTTSARELLPSGGLQSFLQNRLPTTPR